MVIAKENAFSCLANFSVYWAVGSHRCTETKSLSVLNPVLQADQNVDFFLEKQIIEMISDACHDLIVTLIHVEMLTIKIFINLWKIVRTNRVTSH